MYVCMYVCMCIYIYIYIYHDYTILTSRARGPSAGSPVNMLLKYPVNTVLINQMIKESRPYLAL